MDYAGGRGNPSAIYKEGVEARKKLEDARRRVAKILACQSRDVIFTSGGTESDNLAVLGVFEANKDKVKNPHIVISNQEHPAVLESAREAEKRGAKLSVLPVEKIPKAIKANTILISAAYGVSETGAIQDVAKVARAVKEFRRQKNTPYPYFHTDATQAFEFSPCDIGRLGVDLLTIGNVFVVRPNVAIKPIIFGGGQERGLRSGTENVAVITATADEFELVEQIRAREASRLEQLKEIFLTEMNKHFPNAVINTPEESLPNIVSVSFPNQLHEFLAIQLDEMGICVSTGSSCDTNKDESDKEALRFSFGRETTVGDIEASVSALRKIVL